MRLLIAILLSCLMLLSSEVKAQNTFDPGNGCLNVVDFAYAPSIGNQADVCFSFNYRHELFLNEQLSIGVGIGYSHRKEYKLTNIPLYFSTTYFFVDSPFSPFCNLRAGVFAIASKKNVDTKESFSISSEVPPFNMFLSPSIGLKMHLSEDIGIMVSGSYDSILLNSFDAGKNNYRNKLVSNWGINVGLCFQIPNW